MYVAEVSIPSSTLHHIEQKFKFRGLPFTELDFHLVAITLHYTVFQEIFILQKFLDSSISTKITNTKLFV